MGLPLFSRTRNAGRSAAIGALLALLASGGRGLAAPGDAVADAALGQPDLTSNTFDNPAVPPAGRLHIPLDVAVDGLGRLYVADAFNRRVLRFASAAGFMNGEAATLVLGQADFSGTVCNRGGSAAADTLCFPSGLAVDAQNRVYVADSDNHRVLRYAVPTADGQPAEAVLGQADFLGSDCNRGGSAAANTLCDPLGLALDSLGRLYTADRGNHRVLRHAAGFTSGASAELVLGKAGFSGSDCNRLGGPAASTLCFPQGLDLDSRGRLHVADAGNNRVLRYASPTVNGQAADRVFGQNDFRTGACNRGGGPAANTLCHPGGVAFDDRDRLYVADSANNRVLRYARRGRNLGTARRVIGQADFTSVLSNGGGSVSASGLASPVGLALDGSGNLLVVDRDNKRVLRFDGVASLSDAEPRAGPARPGVPRRDRE